MPHNLAAASFRSQTNHRKGYLQVKVIILGAGQGKRLLPLTEDIPKALLDIGSRRLVERQIDAFVACGINEFVVITGYADDW